MFKKIMSLAFALAVLFVAGCGSKEKQEPQFVKVQHILIAFEGSVPGPPVNRTQEEARTLADEVLKRAKTGEDFEALVKEYSADQPPGIYRMANAGQPGDPNQGVYQRTGMVKGFGDVSFALEVGEIGMSPYDSLASKYGWHIIKRLE
jgi:hypothetical protein